MPLKLRHDDETPAPRLQNSPALALAPESQAQTRASVTPTFEKMGRALASPRLKRRPKLTRRNAAILLDVSTLAGMRYIDANIEPD